MQEMHFESLAERFRCPDARAIVLVGSFARGDAGPFSDVDLLRFLGQGAQVHKGETHLVNGRFVVVSDMGPSEVERCFIEPVDATECIAGLRTARALWDPDGHFDFIQQRARAFVWDKPMQEKADAWASAEMVGWIEEAHKGLEGLRRGDDGRLLNARYGLSWGLTKVMRVQRGVLISGDNASYPEVVAHIGPDSEWAALSRGVFGIDGSLPLQGQVKAGLRLYVATADLLTGALKPEDQRLVDETINRIRNELGDIARRRPRAGP